MLFGTIPNRNHGIYQYWNCFNNDVHNFVICSRINYKTSNSNIVGSFWPTYSLNYESPQMDQYIELWGKHISRAAQKIENLQMNCCQFTSRSLIKPRRYGLCLKNDIFLTHFLDLVLNWALNWIIFQPDSMKNWIFKTDRLGLSRMKIGF